MNKYFDRILNRRFGRGLCHRCGSAQMHGARWCTKCGGEFCKHEHTLFDIIKICSNITFEKGRHSRDKRPYFIGEIWKLQLKANGYTSKQFVEYIEQRLIEE